VTPVAHHGSNIRLFVLCGLPFSGKTTLARALARQLPLEHIEVDAVHRERGVPAAGRALGPPDWRAAYVRSRRRAPLTLRQGSSVIFDAMSHRRGQREQLQRPAQERGAPMTIIYLDLPLAEINRRRADNLQAPHRPAIPDAEFNRVAEQFEPPQPLDGIVVRYTAQHSFETWIAQVLSTRVKEQL